MKSRRERDVRDTSRKFSLLLLLAFAKGKAEVVFRDHHEAIFVIFHGNRFGESFPIAVCMEELRNSFLSCVYTLVVCHRR